MDEAAFYGITISVKVICSAEELSGPGNVQRLVRLFKAQGAHISAPAPTTNYVHSSQKYFPLASHVRLTVISDWRRYKSCLVPILLIFLPFFAALCSWNSIACADNVDLPEQSH